MGKSKSINMNKIRHHILSTKIKEDMLNELFYLSLFDYGAAFEENFPTRMLNKLSIRLKKILRQIFPNPKKYSEIHKILKSNEAFSKFEVKIIGTDFLCRLILLKQLRSIGVKIRQPKKGASFDLETSNNIKIELKRICSWTNYSTYLTDFLNKLKSDKALFVVASTCTFDIKDAFPPDQQSIVRRHIGNMARSHYVIENLIRDKYDAKLVIGHIDKEGIENFNLISLCNEIERKLTEFGD